MKIAVIEDEKPIREGLVHILNKISPEYQVVGSAENGAEGLILLEEEMPDLIMLDIQMPDMDGLQMLKEARARGIYTKVIILTAYSDFSYAKKAIELGIENYLLKPVNLTELKKTLEKIKEELFVEQRGKNSLSLEKILKDILMVNMRRMKGWTLCWQIIMESFRDTACIVCTFSLENIMKVRRKKSDYFWRN